MEESLKQKLQSIQRINLQEDSFTFSLQKT